MAISQNFPSTRPTLNLNFARSRKLDSRITFTRGSTATYVDDAGLIRTAGINEARFDYDPITGESLGLLIEESRTNSLTYSEDFTNAAWILFGTTSRTANTVTAPDGNTTADTIVVPNSSGMYQFFSTSAGITYTFSVWLRTPSSPQNISIVLNTNLGDPVEKTITVTSTWQRFSVTKTTGVGTTLISSQLSQGSGGTFYAWGAQTEVGSFPTSYIPTVASTVTRSADSASITGTNFSDWYNSTEGTLFAAARINALGGGTYPGITYIDDGTASNSIGFYVNDAGNDGIGAEAYVSNVGQYGFGSPSAIVPNQLNKVITAYKANDFAAAYSMGGSVGTDNSGSVPTVNRLIIGDLRGSNAPLNGTIAQLTYYPVRLSNSFLQTLTK